MKQKGRAGKLRWMMLPLISAVVVTGAVSLLSAYLMQSGIVPLEWDHGSALLSIGLGALAAGGFAGGSGKHGLMIGVAIALMWCLGRGITDLTSLLGVRTISGIALCIVSSWIGSCIFHKKKRRNTKRNRRGGHP